MNSWLREDRLARGWVVTGVVTRSAHWRDVTRSQLNQLAAAGNDGLKPRVVAHEACFPTKTAKLRFVERVSLEGFGGERGKIAEEDRAAMPFDVTFSRVDAVTFDMIELLVTQLIVPRDGGNQQDGSRNVQASPTSRA